MIRCPKCGSSNTYDIGNGHGCRMCGKQFTDDGVAPIIITKILNERKKQMLEEIKKYPSGKNGVCTNCGKNRFIADKDGRCSTCSRAAKPNNAVETPASGPNKHHPATRKSSMDMTIAEVGRTGKTRIIEMMQAERAMHISEADKLAKAINMLGGL